MKTYFLTKPNADNYFYILTINHSKQTYTRELVFDYLYKYPEVFTVVSLDEMNRISREIDRDHYKLV